MNGQLSFLGKVANGNIKGDYEVVVELVMKR
jgi:hypothetical protein